MRTMNVFKSQFSKLYYCRIMDGIFSGWGIAVSSHLWKMQSKAPMNQLMPENIAIIKPCVYYIFPNTIFDRFYVVSYMQ